LVLRQIVRVGYDASRVIDKINESFGHLANESKFRGKSCLVENSNGIRAVMIASGSCKRAKLPKRCSRNLGGGPDRQDSTQAARAADEFAASTRLAG
jgi:hypothetical protein